VKALLTAARALGPRGVAARHYSVEHLPVPAGVRLEVGGMDFLPDGRLAVSTRRGELWLVSGVLERDLSHLRYELFAEGLHEGLGLAVVEGSILVLQRGELSRLEDADGDGRCDLVTTLSAGWGLSGNYHEFAFGLPRGDEGELYVGLNLGFFDPEWWHGRSRAPWRGWVLAIEPDGTARPVASGFRSPCGLGRNAAGEIFVTDNQGDWVPSSPIHHLRPGRFYGHPASLVWSDRYRESRTLPSDTVPPSEERTPPAVWLPYKWSRSTGNLIEDQSGGRFGPFAGQLLVAELTNGMLLRVALERVRGEYQGACWPLRQGVGSAVRLLQAPDGSVLVGLTNRGWGGLPPSDGIARVRYTGVPPMEMQRVRLLQRGFEIEFTLPLAAGLELGPEDVALSQYAYDWWWEYGSPERLTRAVPVERVELSEDRRRLRIEAALEPAWCARVVLSRVVAEDGSPLLHEEFAYTVNQLPEGPATREQVARLVPPPPARERAEEGWLRLTWGDATGLFEGLGWVLCDAELDRDDPRRLALREGDGALVKAGPGARDLVSRVRLGDGDLHLDFLLPSGGGAALLLQERYELLLADQGGAGDPALGLGAIAGGEGFPARPPALASWRGPGLWHSLDLSFEAPRFDAEGHKLANARFARVRIDDVMLHESVELPGPSSGGLPGEEALGAIAIRGGEGLVAIRDLRFRPRPLPGEGEDAEPFVPLLQEEEELLEWRATGEGAWSLDRGVLLAQGQPGQLWSPRADWSAFELRARCKISDLGRAGLWFRARPAADGVEGYQLVIASSHPEPERSGSLAGLAPLRVGLVGPDTWFELWLVCQELADGLRIAVSVNGVLVNEWLDRERRHGPGHLLLSQEHAGSVLELRELRIRELPAAR
jgi:glucose/arabinose dehydrogenase